MLSLNVCIAGIIRANATEYVAMPKTSAFTYEAGRPVPASFIALHRLILTKTDADGTSHFLLDGKTPVKSTARDLIRKDGLRPLVTSNELAVLRQRYVGRDLWTFGRWNMAREPIGRGTTQIVYTYPGERIRIAAIFELERAPVECGPFGISHNGLGVEYSIDDSLLRARKGERVFLFLYAPSPKLKPALSYTAGYNLLVGDWFLDQAFSPKPPPKEMLPGIRRFLATRYSKHPYLAHSHLEAAWIYGWPMERKPLKQILREKVWTDNQYYSVGFRGDRVVSYYVP